MDELLKRLDAERSMLNNLKYARSSTGRPGAMMTLEEIDAEITKQEAVVQGIIDELNAIPVQ